jgi:hypothetical protein
MMFPLQLSRFKRSFCEGCALAKSTKTPINHTPQVHREPVQSQVKVNVESKIETRVVKIIPLPLTSWSVDLKGPFNDYYIQILVCKRCRLRYIYFLKFKSEALFYFKLFLLKLAIDSAHKAVVGELIVIKSDNGGEFTSAEWRTFCLDKGIRHDHTSPYSPFQNGISERSNRSGGEMAQAQMITANIPVHLSKWAWRNSIYIQNRMPTKALDMRSTPYFIAFGKIPDLSHMRVLGCDVYANLCDTKRLAAGHRASKGIFCGYSDDSLAYIYYDNASRKTLCSGSLVFNEDVSSKLDDKENIAAIDRIWQNFAVTELSTVVNDFIVPNDPNQAVLQPAPVVVPAIPQAALEQAVDVEDDDSDNDEEPEESLPPRRPRKSFVPYNVAALFTLERGVKAITSGKYYDTSFSPTHLDFDGDRDRISDTIAAALQASGISPITFEEGMAGPDREHWIAAVVREIKSLSDLGTWQIVSSLPRFVN